MKVEFLAKFSKDLDKITDSQIKTKVIEFIEMIEKKDKLSEIPNIKKLSGYRIVYRYKLGDYRIGFFFENNVVELARMLHRKEIYKLFP